ncbi:MAG: DUF2892 domain-containing protein [Alphaproteobacteria bacterium]|nr:DUF2892 domain-containing protein [Alphaproteobacteria bacterium]
MTANLGSFDRLLRLVIGIILLVAPFLATGAFAGNTVLTYGAIAIGAILVVTALFRFCPIYRVFGWKTCRA